MPLMVIPWMEACPASKKPGSGGATRIAAAALFAGNELPGIRGAERTEGEAVRSADQVRPVSVVSMARSRSCAGTPTA